MMCSQQKHAIRIVYSEDRLPHTTELFKDRKVLNVYQGNILFSLNIFFFFCFLKTLERFSILFTYSSYSLGPTQRHYKGNSIVYLV